MKVSENQFSSSRSIFHTEMERSIYRSVLHRQIHPCKVRKRPDLSKLISDGGLGNGILQIGAEGPPLQLSFAKTSDCSHILAVSDEDGFLRLYNTRVKLPSESPEDLSLGDGMISEWKAHNNAVFDLCWLREDACMITASGDQTIKLWDVETQTSHVTMEGHTGSIKTLSPKPCETDCFASGSRDGSIALWDVRTSSISKNSQHKSVLRPVGIIKDAHFIRSGQRVIRRIKAASKSVTAVLYLKDGYMVASAGDADSVVKFWDTRKLKESVVQTPPQYLSSLHDKKARDHGITCLAQDTTGSSIIASCRDSRIYLHSTLHPGKGPLKIFKGHEHDSFYIKAAFSPDGSHILSGSSEQHAFIWQVDKPEAKPTMLKGHDGEVTAVDWCPGDFCKIATCSDDYTVRVWSIVDASFESQPSTPTSFRRQILANPSPVSHRLFDEEATKQSSENKITATPCAGVSSSTPQGNKISGLKRVLSMDYASTESPNTLHCREENGLMQKAAQLPDSPSSVLSPPSSVRRKTILDYFGSQ